MTNCAVVLFVGAKLFGHISISTWLFKTTEEFFAREELISPVMAISGFFVIFKNGTKSIISGVFPLFEIQIITSSFFIIPRSP